MVEREKPLPFFPPEAEEEDGLSDLIIEPEESRLKRAPVGDITAIYFREIRGPLLKAREEKSLAMAIERGRQARRELDQNEITTLEDRERLTQAIEEETEARRSLIEHNTRLVVDIAKKFLDRGLPFMDLVQEGNLGLMKAVEKFDHTLGYRFSTYATWWIRQTINRAITDQGRTIRVPAHMAEKISVMEQRSRQLAQKLGREPTDEEIAQEMHLPLNRVRLMRRAVIPPLSLDQTIGEETDGDNLASQTEDPNSPSPRELADQEALRQEIEKVLSKLKRREREVLRRRFGLEDGREYTLEEIGQMFGLTRERIRQIEAKALRWLRLHPAASELKAFWIRK